MRADAYLPAIPDGIQVYGCPHPLRGARIAYLAPVGASVAAIVADGFERLHVPQSLRGLGHAYIGRGDGGPNDGRYVPPEAWATTYPAPGEFVTYRIVPQGGKGSNILATVLMIAVMAVAAVVTAGVASLVSTGAWAWGVGLGGVGGLTTMGGIAGVAAGMAVAALGLLAVNSLVSVRAKSSRSLSSSSGSTDPDVYSISGASNAVSKWGAVPIVLGTFRYVPPLGASNFSYISGDDQYVEQLFVVSYGPVEMSDIRLGDTGIEYFTDYQIETRNGTETDAAISIHSASVTEESLSIKLKHDYGWSTRVTKEKTTRIGIDIVFPSGLSAYNSSGSRTSRSITLYLQYRLHTGDIWTDFPDAPSGIVITGCQSTQVRRSYFVDVAEGKYDVRVYRVTADNTSTLVSDDVYWNTLRSFHASAPIQFPYPLAKIALRMKATDQLNGYVDNLSVLVKTVCLDYDVDSNTWISRTTNNPASLFRYVLQCNANVKRASDAMIDLDQLAYWHTFCRKNGFTYNRVLDQTGVSVFSVLQEIAAAGRAGVSRPDGRWSVVIDEPKTVMQVFTPRNSWGFKSTKIIPDLPHGFRVTFNDETNDDQEDEYIVYADGYTKANANKFEQLALPGVTNTDQIYKLGRHHLACATNRMEAYEWYTSMEYLVCTRGDLVRCQHDVTMVGICSGRIKSVDATSNSVVVDEPCTMVAGTRYTLRFRENAITAPIAREVVANAGAQTLLTFADSGTMPSAGNLFTFGELESDSGRYVVKSIDPLDNFQAKITAMDYSPEVFEAANGVIPAFDPHITKPYAVAGLITVAPILGTLRSDESVLEIDASGRIISRIYVPFSTPSGLQITSGRTEVQYRRDTDTAWQSAVSVGLSAGVAYVSDVSDGASYYVRLRFADNANHIGPWAVSPLHTVVGKTSLPPDVPTFLRDGGDLRWTYPDAPLDLAGFKIRTAFGVGVGWEQSVDAHSGILTSSTFDISAFGALVRTWLIRAIDVAGNLSAHAAVVTADIGGPEIANIVLTQDCRAAGYPGTITGGARDATGYLSATSSEAAWPDDSAAAWPADDDPAWGSCFDELHYIVAAVPPDIASTMSIAITYAGQLLSLLYDAGGQGAAWPTDIEAAWPDDDDPAWWEAEWVPLPDKLGIVTPTLIQVAMAAGLIQGIIEALSVVYDVPDISESLNDVVVAATGTRLPITKSYQSIQQVILTVQDNGGTGIYARCCDKIRSGPLVTVCDVAGAAVGGLVDAIIKGY